MGVKTERGGRKDKKKGTGKLNDVGTVAGK